MQQLRYADEVRPFAEVPIGEDVELKEAELKLAMQLIEQIATDEFQPEKYRDEVRERDAGAIEQKVDGPGDHVATAPRRPRRRSST